MEMTQSGEEDSARGSIIQKKLNISAYCFFVKLFYRIILIVHVHSTMITKIIMHTYTKNTRTYRVRGEG